MSLLIKNIGLLVNVREQNHLLRGAALSYLPCIKNAYLIVEDGRIKEYGSAKQLTTENLQLPIADAVGAYVLPCWCDSHTHLVFAASREDEFVDKIKGLSYPAIAAKGGGILNSANKLQAMNEDELFDLAIIRLN